MKKILIVATVAMCSVFAFTSCKSTKESAYKKAYDSARLAESEEGLSQENEPVEIAPVVSSTKTVTTDNDTSYRTESVVVASGSANALKAFSVVCGSFSKQEGAETVKATLVAKGYNAIIVQNPETKMYRVVCGSFDDKQQAAEFRAQFKAANRDNADFQKAWLLYNK